MKLSKKITLLVITLAMAISSSLAITAFAEKPTNPNPLYPLNAWWGGSYDGEAQTLTVADGAEATTAPATNYNWYVYDLKITNVTGDWSMFYQVGGENPSSPRPWGLTAGATYFYTRSDSIILDGAAYGYSDMGVNLIDGNVHTVEIVLDTVGNTAYYWFDDYLIVSKLESLIVSGATKPWVVSNAATVALINPRTADTAAHVEISALTDTVKVGQDLQLAASIAPEGMAPYSSVTWTSSDNAVATVDASGLVHGEAIGTAKIKATAQSGVYAEYEVNVIDSTVATESISFESAEVEVLKTQTATLTVNYNPADATQRALVWESSDETVVTVENGVIYGASVGTAEITATLSENENISATCTVTVKALPLIGFDVAESVTLEAGTSVKYAIAMIPAAADDEYEVIVSDESVVTYADGKLTGHAAGTATVTVKSKTNEEIVATSNINVLIAEKPEGMPEYDERQEISYVMGVDPSIIDQLQAEDDHFTLTNLAGYSTTFPMNGASPDSSMTANAMVFAMRIDTEFASDWCAAVLFRTASPSTVFFSNPSGIELRYYPDRIEVYFHHGEEFALVATANGSYVDNITHFYAMEMPEDGKLTVWIDGEKAVDAVDLTEYFGKYYNVSENNSFAFTTYNAAMIVTDLHLYDTSKEIEPENPDDSSSEDTGSSASSDTTSTEPSVSSDTESKAEEKSGCAGAMGTASALALVGLISVGFLRKKRQ